MGKFFLVDRSKGGDANRSLLIPLCSPSIHGGHAVAVTTDTTISPTASCTFCRERQKTNGRFYNFSTNDLRLYVYSAFYDDRPSLLATPVVRIVAIGDSVRRLKKTNVSLGLFCVLYHSDHSDGPKTTRVAVVEGDARDCGPSYALNRSVGVTTVFTCPTADGGHRPHSLSIVGGGGEGGGDGVSSCMPVEYPTEEEEEEDRLDLVVCVPVSYGALDPFRIIEWLEVQRLMGVKRVAVYDLYLASPALEVLRAYEAEGFVELRKIDRVFPRERHRHLLELAVSLNDCLYRHARQFQRIVVNDFDEFIRPQKHRTLPELIAHLTESVNGSTNYVVRNAYFFLDDIDSANVSSRFTILRHLKRAPVSPMWHRVKPIITTDSCTHLYSHLCLGLTRNFSRMRLTESVDPALAVTQHYRRCPLTGMGCVAAMKMAQRDDSILEAKEYLTERMRERVRTIMNLTEILL